MMQLTKFNVLIFTNINIKLLLLHTKFFSTPKKQFTSPADVSSASPIEFSQLQLQSILNKGQTVKKITQMRDIMQNEGWRSVSSKSGEYQVFLNSQSPVYVKL